MTEILKKENNQNFDELIKEQELNEKREKMLQYIFKLYGYERFLNEYSDIIFEELIKQEKDITLIVENFITQILSISKCIKENYRLDYDEETQNSIEKNLKWFEETFIFQSIMITRKYFEFVQNKFEGKLDYYATGDVAMETDIAGAETINDTITEVARNIEKKYNTFLNK